MIITNQKPVVLSPVYTPPVAGDFRPDEYLLNAIVKPLFTPLVQGKPVTFKSNSNALSEDDIKCQILNCLGDNISVPDEAIVKHIFQQTLSYFDEKASLNVQDTFVIQAACMEKLPFPTQTVVYTPATDVIPSCKEFLAGIGSYEKMFASLAMYARPKTLGFYFANEVCFEDFKSWLKNEISNLTPILSSETIQQFSDFQKYSLSNLTESFILRNNDSDNNDELSFARVLISHLMLYSNTIKSDIFGVLPFDMGELFCPRTVVFVNVEQHAHAKAKAVADEWKIINKALSLKIKIVNSKKLRRLTGVVRATQRFQGPPGGQSSQIMKSATQPFSRKPLSNMDMTKIVKRIIDKMGNINKSENSYKYVKTSFARPNRRDPDDFNKMGKSVSTKYKPDIHLYIDTSGSISELNYQAAIKSCIQLAKKLNVNLYFNSFSHRLSSCSKLNTKDKSSVQIYKEFQHVPKVTGGTDFEQIWHYINASRKRERELSIIVTDFGWSAPNRYVKHPKNLFYIPCSNMDWDEIVKYATAFCKSMNAIDPNCRKHILF